MDLRTLARSAHELATPAIPGLRLDEAWFHDWASAHGIEPSALASHGVDLVMAAACGAGDTGAITAFDQRFVRGLRPSVSRVPLRPEQLDELRQILRVRMLTGPDPKIRLYRGNGPLGAWIRVTAARIALELHEATNRHARDLGTDAAINALVASEASPELMAARSQHHELFTRELQRCFRELDEQQKTLLRMHYLHDMGIDEMSTILRVHRATVARWLVAVRKRIFDQICGSLQIEIDSGTAVRSLIRLVRSELDISLGRALDGSVGAVGVVVEGPAITSPQQRNPAA
jgi:RNA polymerase sigma-70 factor (ECF subfamily)